MRTASRAIIIYNQHILLMHRDKFGMTYDTLPGGNMRGHETPLDALNRELAEELQMQLSNPRLVFVEHAGHPYGDQYHFLCDYISGEPKIAPGSEEDLLNKMGKNLHTPVWIPLDKLAGRTFRTKELQQKILEALDKGWPEEPVEFASKP